MDSCIPVVTGLSPIKIVGRGRPRGSGSNLRLLNRMKPGDSIWELTFAKAHSIRVSGQNAGIRVKVRRQPESDRFALWKI